ncbi:hypothetical protein [Xanthomonas sp. F14]|jgi:hypothetical protein
MQPDAASRRGLIQALSKEKIIYVTADQIHSQIEAAVSALEKLSVKEREQKPHQQFGENYNNLLSLAKEAMPSIDARRWTPEVVIHKPAMGVSTTNATYVEIHSYFKQLLAILSDSIEPIGAFTIG